MPCTRLLNFQVRDGKLDLTVYMRSNDVIFGFSAVNVFNFTLIQEYIANILKIPVGKYYHVVNNFHYYEDFEKKVDEIINSEYINFENKLAPFYYSQDLSSLEEFDELILSLFEYEKGLRSGVIRYEAKFGNDLFDDWGKIFYRYHTNNNPEFINPYLNRLFYGM